MAKQDWPEEFPSEWHYQQHLVDLERELAGRLARKAELESLNTTPDVLEQAEADAEAVRKQLAHYNRQASKRPKAAGSQRA